MQTGHGRNDMYSSIRSRCVRRVRLAVAALEARDDAFEREHVRAAPAHPVAVAARRRARRRCRRGTVPAAPRSGPPTASSSGDLVALGDRLDHRLVEARVADRPRHERAFVDRERRSGTSRSGSISCCAPSPVQRGHAPCGELNEKMRGCSSGQRDAVIGAREVLAEEERAPRPSTRSIDTRPSASCAAVSTDCASRVRRSAFITSRSTTTSIVCLNFLSSAISSSSSRCSPSTLTRVKPFAPQLLEDVLVLALAVAHDRCVDGEPRSLGERRIWSTIASMALARDRPAADGAVRPPDPRVEQAQVVVDLRDGADGRARVPRRRLLVDRDRRREPVDRVDVGLLHHLQELARVSRERLDVAALALRVDRVEGKADLPEPESPVMQMSLLRGSRTVMSLRLCSLAP